MFTKVLKLSAPIAGAILLVTVGFANTASAAPRAADAQVQSAQAELVVKIDHRKGNGRKDWKGHRGKHGDWKGHRGRNGDWSGRHGGRHFAMEPRQIRRSLRHRGFHKIQIVDRRGPVYIVKARAWGGQKMRLVVDSRTAHIVRSRSIGHGPRRYGPWY
ncbi:hypothetical protein [Roseibium sp.]|uniref:hypothetical protein n=1 Tax=Roseibium sp. TaxID=1936156 RepID=UPI00326447A1